MTIILTMIYSFSVNLALYANSRAGVGTEFHGLHEKYLKPPYLITAKWDNPFIMEERHNPTDCEK